MTKLLVVDDHDMVRGAFCRLLDAQADLEVIGQASSFTQALLELEKLQPDIVCLDLDLPDLSGCGPIVRFVKQPTAPRVIVCSYRAHPAEVAMLMAAGVHGYVTKSSPTDELLHAVRQVAIGYSYFCARSLNAAKEAREANQGRVDRTLTARQLEVLTLVAKGLSTKGIGEQLALSAKTIENYRSAILRRLDARNLAHAVTVARSLGLLND